MRLIGETFILSSYARRKIQTAETVDTVLNFKVHQPSASYHFVIPQYTIVMSNRKMTAGYFVKFVRDHDRPDL